MPSHDGVPRKVVVYQLVVRTFSNTNETRARDGTIEQNGVGRFDDIDDVALAALADLGVTHVWLTGVLRQATLTDHGPGLPADDPDVVKGRAGSFCNRYSKRSLRRRVLKSGGSVSRRFRSHGMAVWTASCSSGARRYSSARLSAAS